MFEFSGLNELWLGESLGLWLWYPLHTKPREHSMVTEHANTDSWLQPLALVVSGRGPLASLCRCQKCRRRNKTQRSRSRSGGDKSLIWSRHGPWPVIVDITQADSAVYSPGIRKLFDTGHRISRGRRGMREHCDSFRDVTPDTESWPGENVRHNSIHQPLASCLRVRMQVVMRPWGGGCITRALWAASPNITVSLSTRERPRVNGPTLNWQLSNPFLSARVSGTLFFSSSPHTTTFIKRLGELKKTERSWMRPAIITQNTQQERRLMMKRMEDDKQNVSVSPFPGMTSVIWSPGAFLRSIVIPAKIMPLLFSSCRRIPQ